MKTIYLKILFIFTALMFIYSINVNAVEIKEQVKVNNLKKYEMVFIYPEGQEENVENTKKELNNMYSECSNNLIITEKKYNVNDCVGNIIISLELQGDISYRSIVFAFTNSDLCENIENAILNMCGSSKYIEGVSRMKVVTIPIDETAEKSLNEWKQGKENWLNYKYEENPNEAINEVYEELGTTKEEFENTKDKYQNGFGNILIDNNSNKNNEDTNTTIVNNEDLIITNKIEKVEVVLSDGNIIIPEVEHLNELATIYLDTELMHGATVLIQNEIVVEKNIPEEIKDINLKYTTNKNYDKLNEININGCWELNDNENILNNNTIELGVPKKVITSQVITVNSEIDLQNIVKEVEYTKITIDENEEQQEIREKVECSVKSENLLILSEQ